MKLHSGNALTKALVLCFALLISGCVVAPEKSRHTQLIGQVRATPAWKDLPVYDHIVIVVEENKDFARIDDDENSYIVDNPNAPFINRVLRKEGALLTRMYAEEHFSEGNYFWLLSGSNQDVGYFDLSPAPGSIDAPNLASQLIAHGRSFKGFSEDLPHIGSTVDREGDYARKHVPWISFSNIPNGATRDSSSNLTFSEFPSPGRARAFDELPTVSVVVPNLKHDMHDDVEGGSVAVGDRWLADNLGAYYEWAKTHNSLLIVTFDEDAQACWCRIGSTNPSSANLRDRNQIMTIFAGAHIIPGEYSEGAGVNHVSLLRTFEAMYGLERSGRQQAQALEAGISDGKVVSDVFRAVRSGKR